MVADAKNNWKANIMAKGEPIVSHTSRDAVQLVAVRRGRTGSTAIWVGYWRHWANVCMSWDNVFIEVMSAFDSLIPYDPFAFLYSGASVSVHYRQWLWRSSLYLIFGDRSVRPEADQRSLPASSHLLTAFVSQALLLCLSFFIVLSLKSHCLIFHPCCPPLIPYCRVSSSITSYFNSVCFISQPLLNLRSTLNVSP